jgi:dTDP-4-dehydrorhamnose reductase
MKKRVAITGANGTVGKALSKHLDDKYDIVPIDRPEIDILHDQKKLNDALDGVDTVIHLAGVFGSADQGKESWRSPHKDPLNEELFNTVLEASKNAGVDKFIHASSIHVEDTMGHMDTGDGLLRAEAGEFSTEPASGYGYAKREQEQHLQMQADKFDRGAVSLRLGGVRPNNLPMQDHEHPDADIVEHERRVWMEHSELADLVGRIIEHDSPVGYDVVYAVSNNEGRIHDTSNRYGWQSSANSADHK